MYISEGPLSNSILFAQRACLDKRRKGEFNGASKRYRDRDLRAIDEWRRRSIHRWENRCARGGPLLSRPDIRKLLHHSAPHAFILLFLLRIARQRHPHVLTVAITHRGDAFRNARNPYTYRWSRAPYDFVDDFARNHIKGVFRCFKLPVVYEFCEINSKN